MVVRGGWEGHAPVEATERFIPFLRVNDFEVRIEESSAAYSDPDLGKFDLIMQCNTMSVIEKNEFLGLDRAIRSGTGYAGWHGGIVDSYRDTADYLQMVGGQFAAHASKEPSTLIGDASDNYRLHRYDITELGRQHEIMAGIGSFELTTEQYWALSDGLSDVLATTTQAVRPWDPWHREITFPAVWTRLWGDGRIFVATPGHSLDVLDDRNVNTIIRRGLLWAAREPA